MHCKSQKDGAEKCSPGFARLLTGSAGGQTVKEYIEGSKIRLSGATAGILLAGLLISGKYPPYSATCK
jgi:hypothetical protein